MKLYHGTRAGLLLPILRDGLKPRGKRKGNWKHTVDSNPDAVYLTNAYAIYFALTASGEGEDMVVIEVDTDRTAPWNMVPDEDFLEQATRTEGPAPIDKPMAYRTRWYRKRLKDFSHAWEASVRHMGTAAHLGVIPPLAITRHAIIPHSRKGELIMAGMDPMISIMNYRFVGEKYRNWMHWLFDEPYEGTSPENIPEELRGHFDPAFMRNVPRDGIELGGPWPGRRPAR